MVHEVAAAGFSDPGDYEAARPSYPPDAVAWFVEHLRIAPGATVVDLAAGTGKLTRLLVPAGADLIAAEPVAGMRATFRDVLPDVPIIATTAEQLAVPRRLARCGHDRAGVPLVRRGPRDRRPRPRGARRAAGSGWSGMRAIAASPWVNDVWSIMDRVEKRAPWRDHENWRDSALRERPGLRARCTPPSSGTSRRSRPRPWCNGSRR